MLPAFIKTFAADTSSQALPFDLAGEWLPVRHDEWYNRLPGKHSKRARAAATKMTYDSDGKGSGWVGEVYVDVQARTIGPGRYSAGFKVRASSKTLPWEANDGHLTLLEAGTLQVQYPSHGIREYWRHAGGCGAEILQKARKLHSAMNQSIPQTTTKSTTPRRNIQLVFRHFGSSKNDGLFWHWGVSVGDSIYEVNGAMAVMGPNGIVAASSPFVNPVRTKLNQFHGYLDLPQTTKKTDAEIEEFSRRWVKQHPAYMPLGPNCQTYADDLFAFLTGEDLPFAKTADKVVGKNGGSVLQGPEAHPRAVWLTLSRKPA